MTYQEILANARTCMGPYCKVLSRVQRRGLQEHRARPRRQGYRHRLHPQLSEVAGAVREHGHHLRERARGHQL